MRFKFIQQPIIVINDQQLVDHRNLSNIWSISHQISHKRVKIFSTCSRSIKSSFFYHQHKLIWSFARTFKYYSIFERETCRKVSRNWPQVLDMKKNLFRIKRKVVVSKHLSSTRSLRLLSCFCEYWALRCLFKWVKIFFYIEHYKAVEKLIEIGEHSRESCSTFYQTLRYYVQFARFYLV
jgi:hypothetical protein